MRSCFLVVLVIACAFAADPDAWRTKVIYQVLTDRFASSNNVQGCGNLGDYCGGNFNGLTDQLSYIQNLGFDAVWISPVVENGEMGYRGY